MAEAEFRQVLAGEPGNSAAHAFLALCLTERKEYKQATEEAQLAVHHEPDSDFAHSTLARVFYDRDRYDEALRHINEAIRLDSESPEHFALLSAIHLDQSRWQPALDAAERGLQIDPEHVGCNNLRAMALVKLGRRDEAGATIASTLERNPDNAITHANKGWALLHEGKHEKALEHFREALRLDPTNEWARQGIVEALKARNFIYAWMLKYFLWMSQLSPQARWGVILGAYFGNRILSVVAEKQPGLSPFIWPIKIIYLIFVVLTWAADPFFNLLLRLNKFGRLALSREQTIASNWLGATILIALVSLAAAFALDSGRLFITALVFGLLSLPVAGVFSCRSGWPRNTFALVTIGLLILGLAAAVELKPGGMLGTFLIGVALSTWLGSFLGQVRPKH